jgi:lactate dehydrogenase-like 2-hydroxyacid dehydrogenase
MMVKPKVYVTRPIPVEAIEMLKIRCTVEMNSDPRPMPKEELLKKLEGYDAILVSRTNFDEEICQAIKSHCLILANYGVGYNNIDVEAASRNGIYVSYNPGVVTEATADLTWALLLATARRIVECDQYVRKEKKDWGPMNLMGVEVSGKTLGIIGAGRIGMAVAQRAKGFNMHIIYTGTKPNPAFEEVTGGIFVEKGTLLKESDFVSIHVPLLPTTRHLISKDELRSMKRTSILLNTSRGPIIDEKALVTALREGEIGGAGLDVFEREPELEPGLIEFPNVTLTPHVGTSTLDTRIKMGEGCAKSIFAAFDGHIPPNCVNPNAGSNR